MTPSISSLRVREAQGRVPSVSGPAPIPAALATVDSFKPSSGWSGGIALDGPTTSTLAEEQTPAAGAVTSGGQASPSPKAALVSLEKLEDSRPGVGPTLAQLGRLAAKGKGLGQLVKGLLRDNALSPLKEELEAINRWAPMASSLTSPGAFAAKTSEFKARLAAGETLQQLRPEVYAVAREAAFQETGMRCHDCQVLGALAMDDGGIAQMATGEGKTLTAVLPLYLNALSGQGAHLITVNDTLAKRDSEWMGPIFSRLGMSVGCVLESQTAAAKRQGYACDITYLTDRTLGFDYLQDRSATDTSERVQRGLAFALIDEVDDVLIDEASTPMILSQRGPAVSSDFAVFTQIVKGLVPGDDFRVGSQENSVWLTEGGLRYVENELALSAAQERLAANDPAEAAQAGTQHRLALQRRALIRRENAAQRELDDHIADRPNILRRLLDSEYRERKEQLEAALQEARKQREQIPNELNLYAEEPPDRVHFLDACLRARVLFQAGKHYLVEGDEIKIIDQGKGRVSTGKRFGLGLHQALEAKEGLPTRAASKTVGRITLPELFSLYQRKAGMSGTAQSSAEEFRALYGLEVVVIPSHRPSQRVDLPDIVFSTHQAKVKKVVADALEQAETGRPVLIGTVSVQANKELAAALLAAGWPMDRLQVLNADTIRNGEDVRDSNAGRSGTITLATGGRESELACDRYNYKAMAMRAMEAVENGGRALVEVADADDVRQVQAWLNGRVPLGQQGATVRVKDPANTMLTGVEHIDAAAYRVEAPLKLDVQDLDSTVSAALKAFEQGQPVVISVPGTGELSRVAERLLDHGLGLESLPMLCEGKEKEKVVIEMAGRSGFITVATNMAGRGADIKPDLVAVERLLADAGKALSSGASVTIDVDRPQLGDRLRRLLAHLPGQWSVRVGEGQAPPQGVHLRAADYPTGGLCVMGTERSVSRRIDDQLIGRAGRQGAPGESRFYLSLEDDLLRIFGGENLTALLTALDSDGRGVSSPILGKLVLEAQRRVENQHLDLRQAAGDYDRVSRQQQQAFYDLRESLMTGTENLREWAADFAASGLAELVAERLNPKSTIQPEEVSRSLVALGLDPGLAPSGPVNPTDLAAALYPRVSTPFQHSQVPQEALKSVVLGILDEAWLDLQDHMETLTDGAHLVAYASAKPEEAYAQEGLKAFQEMRLRIQKDLACKVLPRLLAMEGLPANPTSDSSKP